MLCVLRAVSWLYFTRISMGARAKGPGEEPKAGCPGAKTNAGGLGKQLTILRMSGAHKQARRPTGPVSRASTAESVAGLVVVFVAMTEPLDPTAALQEALQKQMRRVRELQGELEQQRRLLAMEARLSQVKKLESLGVLAGGIAHDYNNLLTSILGNTDLALAHLPPSSPARAHLKHIEYAAQRAADLTRQMLAYSGRGQFLIRPLCLGEIVRGKLSLIRAALSDRVALACEIAPELPAVEGDPDQLGQLLMNLVGNAIDAMTETAGTIRVRADACHCTQDDLASIYLDEQLPEGRYVCLEVTDTGVGMTAETQARMFEPFFSTKFTGRGLGLSAVLGILRGHRGAVRVHSESGKGTTMRLFFPARDRGQRLPAAEGTTTRTREGGVEAAPRATPAAPRSRPSVPTTAASPDGGSAGAGTSGAGVLVIDDEETVRNVARTILERVGFTVVTAASGADGIARFREAAGQFCVVLLDMKLPLVSSRQVFDALVRIRPDVRVVLSSGYLGDEAIAPFDDKGIAGYLQKPYRFEELIACVQQARGQDRQPRGSGSW
jgi:two-component system cell cycle sensor histidine kinase/response regulator CckA